MGQMVRFRRPPNNRYRPQRPPPRIPLAPWLYVVALLGIVAAGQFLSRNPQTKFDGGEDIVAPGNTVRVADGDSIDIGRLRIRLYGIDAPELAQRCLDAIGRSYDCGETAARALQDLVRGKTLRCAPRGIDQYRRTLAVCTAGDSELNAAMVESGNAVAYRENSSAYIAAENRAKAAKRGLWAGRFELPKDYRREAGRRFE